MNADRLMEAVRELCQAISTAIVEQVTPELRRAVAAPSIEPASEPDLLNWRQVAERLGDMSESSVRALWTSGALLSVKVNGLRFTRSADLRAYVEALEPSLPNGEKPQLSVVRDAA